MKVGFQSDRKQPLGIFAILPVVVYLKGVNQLRSILVQWFWWSVYVDFKIDKDMKDIIHKLFKKLLKF